MAKAKIIPGIHNYCDRWCERCPFSSRCAVFAQENNLSPEEKDVHNKLFWDRFSQNLQQAVYMLEDMMKKHGIVPDPLTEEDQQQHALNDLMTDTHPLSELSRSYIKLADEWLKENPDNEETSPGFKEYLDVIEWYKYFISAKLMRALSGKMKNDRWEEENGFQPGYNGSAKVALIAVERSTLAWAALYGRTNSDVILSLLATLEKIKNITLAEFPGSMEFTRPGFDE